MEKRLIELALDALEAKRMALDGEIAELRAELATPVPKRTARRRRGMSAAARRAVSVRMKAYWAKRRAAKAAAKRRG